MVCTSFTYLFDKNKMIILQYVMGLSPYRSGGLTKYTTALMHVEKQMGHDVVALYPGGSSFFHKSCYIHVDNAYNEILTYEMSNPLPVPLMYGIKDTKSETSNNNLDLKSFQNMLDEVKPNVFHIHTLMGLPLEYIKEVHERCIRVVYTSHDYFGLCPKVNFINQDGEVCYGASAKRCAICNANAKSASFLKLRNAKWLIPFRLIARRLIR